MKKLKLNIEFVFNTGFHVLVATVFFYGFGVQINTKLLSDDQKTKM